MKTKKLSDEFQELAEFAQGKQLSLDELRIKVGLKAHALLIIFLCSPFMLPIPLPGLSVVFGGFIIISALGLAFDWPIQLPRAIGEKKISGKLLENIFNQSRKYLLKIEFLIKPRKIRWCENYFIRKASGVVVIMAAMILSLPLPPGFNFPPALVCILISLGLLERDIVLIGLGHMAFVTQLIVYYSIIDYVLNWARTYWPL